MRAPLPLNVKLLVWLLLNFALLIAIAVASSSGDGWQILLSDSVRDRLFRIAQEIGSDLSTRAEATWPDVLAGYQQRLGVRLQCCGPSSRSAEPPPHLIGDTPPPGLPPPPGPSGPSRLPPLGDPPGVSQHGDPGHQFAIAHVPAGYQITLPILVGTDVHRHPAMLLATATSLLSLIRFLGLERWLLLVLTAVSASVLFWLPMLAYLTRNVLRIADATQQIAAGRLTVRVKAGRGDELNLLSSAVNRMAESLERSQENQRNFLADVAHEITSPLSRLQVALGILEGRVTDRERELLNDLQEDAQQMSDLLRELLLFSRADRAVALSAPPTTFSLRDMIETAMRNENVRVRLSLDEDIELLTYRPFLLRALSNLLRNAQRYGGPADRIELEATRQGNEVTLRVRDHGPGIADEVAARLGEPFYRPEPARSVATGGFGLGLAIVKRCVDACGGTATFANRTDGLRGFEATLYFPRSIGFVKAL